MAWETSHTGLPLVKPLFWHDEDDPRLRRVDDAFLLGDHLLVAPVLHEEVTSRSVPLPPGAWYPLDGTESLDGGGDVEVAAPIDHTPVFVRAGAVLPMDEDGDLTLHLYAPPAGASGGGLLYRDAGDGYGPWRVDRYTLHNQDALLLLERASEGDFADGPVRTAVHGAAGLA